MGTPTSGFKTGTLALKIKLKKKIIKRKRKISHHNSKWEKGRDRTRMEGIFFFLLTYSAVSSVSHWAENKRGFARENTRGERRERQRHSMRKKSLSKQPHKVRSYQASMKEEVEWEKLVDSTVAFVCLKRFPRQRRMDGI